MRYLVEHNFVQVLGRLWLPDTVAATCYTLSAYDLVTMRDEADAITSDSVASWLALHTGDFQEIFDFRASIGAEEIPWADEEHELTYHDCMYGDGDE